ncbi:hypothetical protein L210DRAFT_3556189 [Boletus edulis BED1]|uniref:Glycosyltransferase family 25 protein n=1 Tax=Boletus edulis BED1 TaxID=1328754 RepID=A0AAD4BLJ1_BOLED|nr:hypothetical protein L210DRAFT_3556189 [Boletus edulis BED1]
MPLLPSSCHSGGGGGGGGGDTSSSSSSSSLMWERSCGEKVRAACGSVVWGSSLCCRCRRCRLTMVVVVVVVTRCCRFSGMGAVSSSSSSSFQWHGRCYRAGAVIVVVIADMGAQLRREGEGGMRRRRVGWWSRCRAVQWWCGGDASLSLLFWWHAMPALSLSLLSSHRGGGSGGGDTLSPFQWHGCGATMPSVSSSSRHGGGDTSSPFWWHGRCHRAVVVVFSWWWWWWLSSSLTWERGCSKKNLTWTVVDAVPSNATLVNRIFDWVTLYHTESSSKVLGTSSFRWPEEINALSVSTHEPWKQSGSDTWAETSPSSKPKFPGKFGSSTYANLACATEDDSILALANDTPNWMVLSPAKVACWHSHVSAIRRFVERQDAHDRHRGDDVAVILEDDIDMEKDISIRLSQIWTFLPVGWDIVFLGHCWSDESYYPALTEFADTYLHPSYHPKCTHAYALSLSGVRRLLQHLRYPPFAYSRALDQAYAWLIWSGRLRSYSIVPSLIVQKSSSMSTNDLTVPEGDMELLEGMLASQFDFDMHYGILPPQQTVIIRSYSDDTDDQVLAEIQPKFVVMFEPNLEFVRRIEVYRNSSPGLGVRVYFMVYQLSCEEHKYLAVLRREKESFERLIKERGEELLCLVPRGTPTKTPKNFR